jgi:CRP-like cAMP-binding protein
VLFLPEELIVWFMRRDPIITENYITYLSDRIWFLNTKISALTAGSAEQRLAVFLLEQGSVSSSMTDLSHQLNVGRASLYRALDVLEADGYIRKGSKSIEVTNEDGLRQLAFPSS